MSCARVAFKKLLEGMADRPQEYVTPNGKMTTNSIEGFHGLALKYRSKRIDLKHAHYCCKTNMAICHKNLGPLWKFITLCEMGVDIPAEAVEFMLKEQETLRTTTAATITVTTTATTSVTAGGWRIVITHPTQMTFTCPACGVLYHLYASLQRHMRDCHKDGKVTWVYVCADCGEELQDKKKVSTHVNCVHVGKAMKKDIKSGAFPCDYCEETFQSSRSRSMHVRNKHGAAQSAHLAGESSLKTSVDSQPRHWDGEMVQEFVRAMFVVGTGSNVEIARQIKSKKTAHNVKGFKLRFLKEHPNWRTEFSHLEPGIVPSPDSEEDEIEEAETITIEETDDTNT